MDRFAALLDRLGVPAGTEFGIGLAALLIIAVRLAVAPTEKRLVRGPLLFLCVHLLALGTRLLLSPKSSLQMPLELLALFFLLVSIGRSLFLIWVHYFVIRRRAKPLPKIIEDLIQIAVYVAICLVVLRAAGVEPGSLLATSALLTAVVGLSLQDTLGNLFAGLAIQAQHPFEVGDWIQFDENPRLIGQVVEINWRATRLVTIERFEVLVPNSTLAKAPIKNFTKPDNVVRRQTSVVAPYSAPPARVRHLLQDTIAQVNGVLSAPPPSVLIADFNERGVEYHVRYFIGSFSEREQIAGEIRQRLWYALHRASWEIPPPQRHVQLKERNAEATAAEHERGVIDREQAILAVDFLKPLDDASRRTLAELAESRLFCAGEVVIRQGDPGSELFIVQRGEVAVLLERANTEAREVAILGPGKFFGEMSLMTGAPRRATIRTRTECEVIVIDKPAFQRIIQSNAAMAESISAVLATRDEALEHSDPLGDAEPHDDQPDQRLLLGKIRRFFSLNP